MKKRIFKFSLFLSIFLVVLLSGLYIRNSHSKKLEENVEIDIEEILKTSNYSYLPEEAKNYIRNYYNDTGVVLLTEKNKEDNQPYLNPNFVTYLANGSTYDFIPSDVVYDFVVPAGGGSMTSLESFDLRDVNGVNYVTPFKNQGQDGLCWDFSSTAALESYLLYTNYTPYNSETAEIFSEKQIDYALSKNGMETDDGIYDSDRYLADGGSFESYVTVLADGIGAVHSDWNEEHADVISNRGYLKGIDIYNFGNSNYELASTIKAPHMYHYYSETEKKAYVDTIKDLLVSYGGAYVGTDVGYWTLNYYGEPGHEFVEGSTWQRGEGWMPVVMVDSTVDRNVFGGHAMELIGWDDNIEYIVCENYKGYGDDLNTSTPCNGGNYHAGKGVWILKNSWGSSLSIMYLAYDSDGTEFGFFTNIRNGRYWDNFYNFKFNDASYYGLDDYISFDNEKLDKIKINLGQNRSYSIQMSTDGGNTYETIDSITTDFGGLYEFDFSNQNIILNGDVKFRIKDNYGYGYNNAIYYSSQIFHVYTDNIDDTKVIHTKDVIFDHENEKYNGSNYYSFSVVSKTKNIDENENLTVKLKNLNGEYISNSFYTTSNTEVYANTNSTLLKIDTSKFPKGNYIVEVCYNDVVCDEALLKIELDFIITLGDGSDDNPWQITNVRQFDLIRNYDNDSFLLMNDIDFEYDTQNENGLLYNGGSGFKPMNVFLGYFDGDNHKLMNIYINSSSDASVFGNLSIRSVECDGKCGIENIYLYNPTIIGFQSAAGIANTVYIYDINLNYAIVGNLNVIGGSIEAQNESVAGIANRVKITYPGDPGLESYSLEGLFNSATLNGKKICSSLIGIPNSDGVSLTISRAVNFGRINCSNAEKTGTFVVDKVDTLTIINSIDINDPEVPYLNIEENGAIGSVILYNIYTSSNYLSTQKSLISSAIRIINGASIYEIANADYSKWSKFDTYWTLYNEDGINRVPVLKNIDFDYYTMNSDVIYLGIGDSLDLKTLSSSGGIKDLLEVSSSCSYDLNMCGGRTDTSVISIDGTTITGLKKGYTEVFVKNEHDGYINTIIVSVGGETIDWDYKVTFNSNGGTGTMSDQFFMKNSSVKLNKNLFVLGDKEFLGWNTKPDGTGVGYSDEQVIELDSNLVLYAIWNVEKYEVTFDPNDGIGEITKQTFTEGRPASLMKVRFTKRDYYLDHWNTSVDDTGTRYDLEEEITVSQNITLYAIYSIIRYTVTFDTMGGEYIPPLVVDTGTVIDLPKPKREGYNGGGWYKDPEHTQYFSDHRITGDITLYASWFQIPVTLSSNGAETTSDFVSDFEYGSGTVLTLKLPEEYGIIVPEGMVLDAYQILGARYKVGQKFEIPETDGIYINCLWKEATANYNEVYEITYKKLFDSTYIVSYNENLEDCIAEKKEESLALLNNFVNGKEHVVYDDYGEIVNGNIVKKFRQFYLLNSEFDPDTNTMTYKYELRYFDMNFQVGKVREDVYLTNKVEEENVSLEYSSGLEEYINNKKNEFSNKLEGKNVNIDDLFVYDRNNGIYKYAEFIDINVVDSTYDSANNKYIFNYNCNYKLVNVDELTVSEQLYKILGEDGKLKITDIKALNNNTLLGKPNLETTNDYSAFGSIIASYIEDLPEVKELIKKYETVWPTLRITCLSYTNCGIGMRVKGETISQDPDSEYGYSGLKHYDIEIDIVDDYNDDAYEWINDNFIPKEGEFYREYFLYDLGFINQLYNQKKGLTEDFALSLYANPSTLVRNFPEISHLLRNNPDYKMLPAGSSTPSYVWNDVSSSKEYAYSVFFENIAYYANVDFFFTIAPVLLVDDTTPDDQLINAAKERIEEYLNNSEEVVVIEDITDSINVNKYIQLEEGLNEFLQKAEGINAPNNFRVYSLKIGDTQAPNNFYIIKANKDRIKELEISAIEIETGMLFKSNSISIPIDVSFTSSDVTSNYNQLNNAIEKAYEINLYSDTKGAYIKSVNGGMKIFIPVSDDFEIGNRKIAYLDENGAIVEEFDINLETINNKKYVTFVTNHLSVYGIVNKDITNNSIIDMLVNPNTVDVIVKVIILLVLTIGMLIGFKKFAKFKRYY